MLETIQTAKIAVSAATYSIDRPYDYLIPASMQEHAVPGVRVFVPFGRGNRMTEGLILSLSECEKSRRLKAIQSVLDPAAVLSAEQIRLALFMRERYFCTMYDAIRTILPAGLWFRTQQIYTVSDTLSQEETLCAGAAVAGAQKLLAVLYANGGSAELDFLQAACGACQGILKSLCEMGLLSYTVDAKRQVKDGKVKMVSLAVTAEDAMAAVERKQKSAPLRYAVIELLCRVGRVSSSEISYYTGASASTITSLKKSGLIEVQEEERLRITEESALLSDSTPIVLNEEQQTAFEEILQLQKAHQAAAVLLHGVTGSGKTKVYIRLAQEVLKEGKTIIVLVPEIALTPQVMGQFSAYFGNAAAMLHSALRMTELYDQWKRIRRGEVKIVLGTRSAIFAPLSNIGMIVMDEEQEDSYQSENPPRYHAREVAQYLCGQSGAVLVLGSATPSIETAYAAKNGTYHLCMLRQRYNRQALPQVLVADMKQELRKGNGGIVSEQLRAELQKNIAAGEQSILFLNRRGNSRMLLCGECGKVPECPRCSVPLTYHSVNKRLMCHYCGHSEPAPDDCPDCGGKMKHVGTGTQKAEEELRAMFPDTRILRMDADTVSIKAGHEKILREFSQKKVPILLGTQMVTKGLDFANVTLVGVLAADLSLYIDHYRAAERTFSLLTQVIGRAGRGSKNGRAVIQTYTPENEVLLCAASQDYERFYQGEIRMRKIHDYPPFSDLFTLVISGGEESNALRAAATLRDAIRRALDRDTFHGEPVSVVGPAPAPIAKVNNRYRYHLYLVAKNTKATRTLIDFYLKAFAAEKENRGLNLFVHCNATD